MKNFDNKYLNKNIQLIAGVDEAGRGPLAGPVVAAAVIFLPDALIEGVDDSKVLSEKRREELFEKIIKESIAHSVSVVSVEIIEEINILNASLLAMRQSVEALKVQPDLIIADGNQKFDYSVPVIPVIKGDAKSFSIAAASILAKVTRDRIMKELAIEYPVYKWEKNKGYPTKQHRESIKLNGTSPFHRKTFLKKLLSEIQLELTRTPEKVG
ncbi:MAG: ribonuclease HII [Candidatus Cloacimonadota bacterium]|nr:MAG: ribonuclease HII [Candidatus Cloacimonadota bacterium]